MTRKSFRLRELPVYGRLKMHCSSLYVTGTITKRCCLLEVIIIIIISNSNDAVVKEGASLTHLKKLMSRRWKEEKKDQYI